MMPYCSCAEIKNSFGKDVASVPEWHNCEYIAKRNKLIPEVWKKALGMINENGEPNEDRLTYVFSTLMDEAAKEAKIV
jgi:hypothetical protein